MSWFFCDRRRTFGCGDLDTPQMVTSCRCGWCCCGLHQRLPLASCAALEGSRRLSGSRRSPCSASRGGGVGGPSFWAGFSFIIYIHPAYFGRQIRRIIRGRSLRGAELNADVERSME